MEEGGKSHMIILNLGVDNSGKTTLSKKILELDPTMLYMPPIGPASKSLQVRVIENSLKILNLDDNINFLYERYPLLDEMVYGPIIRGKSNFNIDDQIFKFWVKNIRTKKHLIIYNRPSDGTIWSTIRQRKQMEGVPDNIVDLTKAYDKVFHLITGGYGLNAVTHNYEIPSSTENIFMKVGQLL